MPSCVSLPAWSTIAIFRSDNPFPRFTWDPVEHSLSTEPDAVIEITIGRWRALSPWLRPVSSRVLVLVTAWVVRAAMTLSIALSHSRKRQRNAGDARWRQHD